MSTTISTASRQLQVVVPRSDIARLREPQDLLKVIEFNGLLKLAVSQALRAIPAVGSLLSGLVGLLWPKKDKPSLQWDKINWSVRGTVRELLADDKVRSLRQETLSLYDLIKDYMDETDGSDYKAQSFNYILNRFTDTKAKYLDNETPWNTLHFFVPMATLHLAFLREQLFHWDEIYPRNRGADTIRHHNKLKSAIEEYTAAATAIYERCMSWRLNERIVKTESEIYKRTLGGSYGRRFVRDYERGIQREFRESGGHAGPSLGYSQEKAADKLYHNLRDSADAVYRQQIEDILAPVYQWPQFLQGHQSYLPIIRDIIVDTTHAMGDGISSNMMHFNDHEFATEYGPITKVVINAGDRINGFEIWYGGISSGHRGGRGGTEHELDVGKRESVVCVSGYIGMYLDFIQFWVSPGKRIAGGSFRVTNFHIGSPTDGPSSDPDTFKLAYVYGWANPDGHIEGFGAAFGKTEIDDVAVGWVH